MQRELRITKINQKIYLFPVPVIKERKYLILCESESQAQQIIQKVGDKTLQHPDLISDDFLYLTLHSDGVTKIYTPKAELK
jgi:hypothetical protein